MFEAGRVVVTTWIFGNMSLDWSECETTIIKKKLTILHYDSIDGNFESKTTTTEKTIQRNKHLQQL